MKVMPYAGLFLALLGGLGIDGALAHPRRAIRIGAGAVAVLGLAAATAWLAPRPLSALVGLLADPVQLTRHAFDQDAVIYATRLREALGRAALLTGVATSAVYLATRGGRQRVALAGLLLVAVQLGDLTAVNGRTLSVITADRSVFDLASPFADRIHALDGDTYGRERLVTITGPTQALWTPEVIDRHGEPTSGSWRGSGTRWYLTSPAPTASSPPSPTCPATPGASGATSPGGLATGR